MVALLKYGLGMPFNRLEVLQKQLGVPLPASVQWALVEAAAQLIKPAHEQLVREAAQGEVLHSDDTSMRVLKLERPENDRTGVFTSGVVASQGQGQPQIALFMTGWRHAGENVADVLKHRAQELGPAIQMSDAASRNVPKLSEGAELLMTHRCWEFTASAPHFRKMQPGDTLVFYLGGQRRRYLAGMATVAGKPEPITDDSPATFNREEIPYFTWRLPIKGIKRFEPGSLGLELVEQLSFAKNSTVERKYIGLLLRGGVRALKSDDLELIGAHSR